MPSYNISYYKYIYIILYIYTACLIGVPMGYNYAQKMSANCSLSLSFPAAHLFAETPSPPPCSWDWVCFSILKASIQLLNSHVSICIQPSMSMCWIFTKFETHCGVQPCNGRSRTSESLAEETLFGFKCQRVPKYQSILIITGRMGIVGTTKKVMTEPWNILNAKEGIASLDPSFFCSPSVIPKATGCLTESPIPCVFIVTKKIRPHRFGGEGVLIGGKQLH